MPITMVRYRLKPDRVDENVRFITRVFEQLEREKPEGLHYATFKQEDGVSFVHIASHDGAGGRNPLTELSAFKEFSAAIRDRCDEPPVPVKLSEVASYRFL